MARKERRLLPPVPTTNWRITFGSALWREIKLGYSRGKESAELVIGSGSISKFKATIVPLLQQKQAHHGSHI
ncbi:MAG: hypothetical protein ACE5J2_08380 [Nitrososphaerales archaeon]